MTYLRFVIALVLLGACLPLSALNWVAIIRRFVSEVAPSWIPMLAGLVGAAATQLFPCENIQKLWWLAFLVDGGSLPGLVLTVVWHLLRICNSRGRPR